MKTTAFVIVLLLASTTHALPYGLTPVWSAAEGDNYVVESENTVSTLANE